MKCIYRDVTFEGILPVASIGCKRATRFGTEEFRYFKIPIAEGWVAFKSWLNERLPAIAGLDSPLLSNIGEATSTEKIDGSPLVFRVEEESLFLASNSPKKTFPEQLLRMWDVTRFNNGLIEYRIC